MLVFNHMNKGAGCDMEDGTVLLVPEPLYWSCPEQEAVTGGQLGRSSEVQVCQNMELDCLQNKCKHWKCHLGLMLWAVVGEDTTKS